MISVGHSIDPSSGPNWDCVFGSPHGNLQGRLIEDAFWINSYFVQPDYRRQGEGTALLADALAVARELGAVAIKAHITTRESIDVMTGFFGEESVTVNLLGEYGQENASASLDYSLPRPDDMPVPTVDE